MDFRIANECYSDYCSFASAPQLQFARVRPKPKGRSIRLESSDATFESSIRPQFSLEAIDLIR